MSIHENKCYRLGMIEIDVFLFFAQFSVLLSDGSYGKHLGKLEDNPRFLDWNPPTNNQISFGRVCFYHADNGPNSWVRDFK